MTAEWVESLEFNCCECGRHVLRFGSGRHMADERLCGSCLMLPGWFRDPAIRDVIDPTHDGVEAM